ncbi:MAG: PilT protein domain-containing protein [Candidatus Saganbacteria bacterium]|uniref:PilT protein domain-containing protein n=1 Tax=Candidatus Saganbacteria bacterium TaxID=2575572 RepID=A0A833NXK4_UNCSA|nr:MAG: PilT protein domain-containing protein [Candidatus Saganbacteria bacterium]
MFLLDTTYCSKIIDKDRSLMEHISNNVPKDSYVATSVVSKGELVYMVEKSERKEDNKRVVRNFLENIDIQPVTSKVADVYGELKYNIFSKYAPKEKTKRNKYTLARLGITENDAWIAALAISMGLTVITKDSDFQRIKDADNRLNYEEWPVS